jgi:hypothetical protein
MALMDAKEYDPRPAQRVKRFLGGSLVFIVVLLVFWFWPSGRFRFSREWRVGDQFLAALEHRDFDTAYGIYNADPDWRRHPEKYKEYTLSQFMLAWGPSGESGLIISHQMDCAIEPFNTSYAPNSGVVISATVNRRTEATLLWIEKKSHSITSSPWDLDLLTRGSPLVRARCYHQH